MFFVYVYSPSKYNCRLRSVLCDLATTFIGGFDAIATKAYFDVELWLSLPGATLFYGLITLIGYMFAPSNTFEFDTVLDRY